jgi:ferrochelatase
MKTAVVLLNLGGPLKRADIRPFLFNFFMDKNIIGAPLPVRWLLAHYISVTRSRGAARTAYKELGYESPLLKNTQAQAQALQALLDRQGAADTKVFVAMRYWRPDSREVAAQLRHYAPDHVILLPLYPQFSTTTSGSSFEDVKKAAAPVLAKARVSEICCYPVADGFIQASVENIRAAITAARQEYKGKIRLLFSAHGLPEKIVSGGDPYQFQCEESAARIAAALNMPDLDWQICYQSRVGPLKWIGPSTLEALQKAAADKAGVILYPHAFVSEHVETLVEIDIDYRRKARAWGIPYFGRAQTVGTHPAFIAALADKVKEAQAGVACKRICPPAFSRCACAEGKEQKARAA